jgi:hypothetical protein
MKTNKLIFILLLAGILFGGTVSAQELWFPTSGLTKYLIPVDTRWIIGSSTFSLSVGTTTFWPIMALVFFLGLRALEVLEVQQQQLTE